MHNKILDIINMNKMVNIIFLNFLLCFILRIDSYSNELPKIEVKQGSLSIPIYIDQQEPGIIGVDITVTYNKNKFNLIGANIKGGILEKHYSINSGTLKDGEISLGIYAINNIVSGSGIIAFIDLYCIGQINTTSNIVITKYLCNDNNAKGGIYVNNSFYNKLDMVIQPFELEDIIDGLKVLTGIEINQYNDSVGIVQNKYSIKDTLKALRFISFINNEN